MGVLGSLSFTQAGLLAEIDRRGTTMPTVEAGRDFTGGEAKLPHESPVRITHLNLLSVLSTGGAGTFQLRRLLRGQ